MLMENPYSLVFGKMPSNYIDRELELNKILSSVEKYFQKREDILIGDTAK